VLWFTSESIRESKNLWILFLYSFPSNFLMGIVPYDPAIIYFGKFYSPLYVTFIGIVSTLVVEGINYSVLNFISNTKFLIKIRHSNYINKIIKLFNNAPFIALLIAGFLPVPFYPFRSLVVLARYPVIKYLLTVLLSKIPRMYLLALVGYVIKIPDYIIISFYIAIVVGMYISFLINHLKK
jgi:membrane protein YqaA with SNARE-associated domain